MTDQTQEISEQEKQAQALAEYEKKLSETLASLHKTLSDIPAVDATMIMRFIASRLGMETKNVVFAWMQDRETRAFAEQQYLDRLRRALKGSRPGDVEAIMRGNDVKATNNKAEGRIN